MNYLVTGGCGFIGVNLIRRLQQVDQACGIRVVDNLTVGMREDLTAVAEFTEIGEKNLNEGPFNGVQLMVADIQDQRLAAKGCKGIDVIVHLAANTGVIPSIKEPRYDCMVNVIGTLNYLEAARTNGAKCFVFASSGAPLGEQVPPIHEEMVPRPISPYGASKLSGEAYCSAFYRSFGLETVILRFGNVYGPHSKRKGSVVAKFIKHIMAEEPLPIYGDGNQTRDFIYVDDLVEAIVLAMEKPNISGEIFQIATFREHTVGEVAEELNSLARKYLGRSSPIVYRDKRKGEVRRNFSDIRKAQKMLGFVPKYDLKRGLEKTFLWFLSLINPTF
ncbi:MAG: NAD-dependent epimerase/dehydratase family protein [Deltaproteobacteria bacterium]|nr:NAD-dependent epimerase/dehydratase family protein [Deltaproteobacteria bacterium]MBW2152220.1 NAD-dependent epimerase/dehydratase family protein [Deltaproteobacteria bacterium]